MIPTPSEALERLKSKGALWGYAVIAVQVLWRAIDAASNIEYALDKVPRLKAVVMPILSSDLLILIGVAWLVFLVMRRGAWSLPWTRTGKLKELLRQAADELRKQPDKKIKFEGDEVFNAAWRMTKTHELVKLSLGEAAMSRMIKWQDEENRKHKEAGAHFNPDAAMARYLEKLRRELKPSDIDPGFHFPDSFAQFLKQDSWIPNSVDAE